ncbi:hypothetical protein Y032_0065g3653 [Ancylostoma ceylanicum]|nr:hypothetical protein Y032_0065g3653 [Ancylostoma ceylanicum]
MSHFTGETSTEQRNMAPDCGSHSNTESDRDANNDDVSSKPAEAEGVIGSSDEEPPAGEDLSEEVYEVEKILDHDDTADGLFYLVHWKGFGEEDDSWEPAENLAFATKAINEYEARRKSKSKKGKKSSSKTPKSKSKQKGHEKDSKRSSSSKDEKSTPASNSKKRGRPSKSSVSDKSESEPEIPSDDEDDEYVDSKQKTTKKSTPTAKYSGTVTKAALKSYSPTTTRASRNSSLSTPMPPVETISAAKKVSSGEFQALQMRQSWLYDSDSDDDSGTEKENEKKMEQNKKNEAEMESVAKVEEEKHRKQIEEPKKPDEVYRPNDRKRKGDEGSAEKKKKSKLESTSHNHHEIPNTLLQGIGSSTSSDQVENGASAAASTSNVRPQDQPEIFAIAQDRDGRIRVLIGVDGVKKVVSLRDAHDVNSWGLVQHILKFASFTDFE